jgi:putative glutamine amidotransferase
VNRPVIAVSTAEQGGWFMWIFCRLGIFLAGGRAVRLTTSRPLPGDASFDGLLLSGGSDIDPKRYGKLAKLGEQVVREGKRLSWGNLLRLLLSALIFLLRLALSGVGVRGTPKADPARDEFELGLIARARDAGLPLLGTCRGMQLINVALGGSLHQDIAEFYEDVTPPHTVLPLKTVILAEGSLLARIFKTTTLRVNALHHQAIDRTGRGLRVCARDNVGVTQAVESTNEPFVVGVQWHPEFLLQHRVHRKIFKAFVRAARECRGY